MKFVETALEPGPLLGPTDVVGNRDNPPMVGIASAEVTDALGISVHSAIFSCPDSAHGHTLDTPIDKPLRIILRSVDAFLHPLAGYEYLR